MPGPRPQPPEKRPQSPSAIGVPARPLRHPPQVAHRDAACGGEERVSRTINPSPEFRFGFRQAASTWSVRRWAPARPACSRRIRLPPNLFGWKWTSSGSESSVRASLGAPGLGWTGLIVSDYPPSWNGLCRVAGQRCHGRSWRRFRSGAGRRTARAVRRDQADSDCGCGPSPAEALHLATGAPPLRALAAARSEPERDGAGHNQIVDRAGIGDDHAVSRFRFAWRSASKSSRLY